jgi:hypothetical protein
MEAICEIAIIVALGILATQFGKIITSIADRFRDLSIPVLHFRLFILSVIATLPLLLIVHYFAQFDWGGYMPLYQLVYLLGIPLILLGEPLVELFQNTFSIRAFSLDLWVLDLLLVLQWILWGQILAIIIRLRRQDDPTTGIVDPIARVTIAASEEIADGIAEAIDKPYQKFTARYGMRQAEAILILAGGLLFILLVCLLVVYSVR